MEIQLTRVSRNEVYTIGKLYINGVYECDTLEDKDRDSNKNGSFDNTEVKVYGQTAIPNGRYEIKLAYSPKFSSKIGGKKLPLLQNVPHFSGVLIHWGNTPQDTEGCILVGTNNSIGRVNNSKDAFSKLLSKMESVEKLGESIYISIK